MRAWNLSKFLEIAGFHDFDSTFYIIDNTVKYFCALSYWICILNVSSN